MPCSGCINTHGQPGCCKPTGPPHSGKVKPRSLIGKCSFAPDFRKKIFAVLSCEGRKRTVLCERYLPL